MSRLWPATKSERAAGPRLRSIAQPDRDEIFARGVAHGRATAEAELASERAALAELVASLEALETPRPNSFAGAIEEIAARLAIAAAGAAAIDRALLADRAAAVAAMLAEALPPTRVCFHPDDLVMIDAVALDCPVVAALDVPRGSVRAEAGDSWAADGVREAVARIVQAAGL